MEVIEKVATNFDRVVLILGVMHGEEPQGEMLINKFLEICEIKNLKNKLFFIPCINSYGKKRNIRQNKNGVDLNRNYPTKNWKLTEKNDYYGGEYPKSEKETVFLIDLIEKIKPDCILSIHAPFRIVNYDGPAQEIAEKISELTGYPLQADIGYPTPGSFGTYFGVERNIPVITLELPENVSNEQLWKENKKVFEFFAYEF
ncbi:DUF2817 domain-containing protein [bacterium]|nr:DUF2817 domain-containing protein [bacterium]